MTLGDLSFSDSPGSGFPATSGTREVAKRYRSVGGGLGAVRLTRDGLSPVRKTGSCGSDPSFLPSFLPLPPAVDLGEQINTYPVNL